MLTVCPKCTLTLAVTAADLRVGQGYVRCGRCATVFNALLALSDASTLELPDTAPPPAPTPAPPPAPPPAAVTQPPRTAASAAEASGDKADISIDLSLAAEPLDMVLEQTSALQKPAVPAGHAGDIAVAADAGKHEVEVEIEADAMAQVPAGSPPAADSARAAGGGRTAAAPAVEARETPLENTGTVHKIVMQGSSISQSEEFVDIDTIDKEIAAATRHALAAEARKSIASLDQDLGASGTHARLDDAVAAAAPEHVETRLSETGSVYVHDRNSLYAPHVRPPKPPPSTLLWGTAAALLALILGVQAIHYWRNDLALRDDWIGRSLTRTYAILGLPLTPNWDLRGYDVRQLGAATNGSGDNAIRVRISLTNRATRALPWPVLRLSLYNRYGKRVAARDLEPRDYLTRGKAADLMPVAQQIDSEVAVMDPGPDASSFELDVCIAGPHGLRCAGDSPLRPSARS